MFLTEQIDENRAAFTVGATAALRDFWARAKADILSDIAGFVGVDARLDSLQQTQLIVEDAISAGPDGLPSPRDPEGLKARLDSQVFKPCFKKLSDDVTRVVHSRCSEMESALFDSVSFGLKIKARRFADDVEELLRDDFLKKKKLADEDHARQLNLARGKKRKFDLEAPTPPAPTLRRPAKTGSPGEPPALNEENLARLSAEGGVVFTKGQPPPRHASGDSASKKLPPPPATPDAALPLRPTLSQPSRLGDGDNDLLGHSVGQLSLSVNNNNAAAAATTNSNTNQQPPGRHTARPLRETWRPFLDAGPPQGCQECAGFEATINEIRKRHSRELWELEEHTRREVAGVKDKAKADIHALRKMVAEARLSDVEHAEQREQLKRENSFFEALAGKLALELKWLLSITQRYHQKATAAAAGSPDFKPRLPRKGSSLADHPNQQQQQLGSPSFNARTRPTNASFLSLEAGSPRLAASGRDSVSPMLPARRVKKVPSAIYPSLEGAKQHQQQQQQEHCCDEALSLLTSPINCEVSFEEAPPSKPQPAAAAAKDVRGSPFLAFPDAMQPPSPGMLPGASSGPPMAQLAGLTLFTPGPMDVDGCQPALSRKGSGSAVKHASSTYFTRRANASVGTAPGPECVAPVAELARVEEFLAELPTILPSMRTVLPLEEDPPRKDNGAQVVRRLSAVFGLSVNVSGTSPDDDEEDTSNHNNSSINNHNNNPNNPNNSNPANNREDDGKRGKTIGVDADAGPASDAAVLLLLPAGGGGGSPARAAAAPAAAGGKPFLLHALFSAEPATGSPPPKREPGAAAAAGDAAEAAPGHGGEAKERDLYALQTDMAHCAKLCKTEEMRTARDELIGEIGSRDATISDLRQAFDKERKEVQRALASIEARHALEVQKLCTESRRLQALLFTERKLRKTAKPVLPFQEPPPITLTTGALLQLKGSLSPKRLIPAQKHLLAAAAASRREQRAAGSHADSDDTTDPPLAFTASSKAAAKSLAQNPPQPLF
ncbi:hypothetical protein DIPPA_10302 [Diplonema papillatum]|nr:hypothetical protein DIPPA_10302 [Diplonema papillatum]